VASVCPIETLRVIHVDRDQRVLNIAEYPGAASSVELPLRAIIGDALRLGTSGLLLSHNHPSGDPTPSRADISITQRLQRAAEALGIEVYDHLVFAQERSVSFRNAGLL
jgi:DNA repair protein RadC